MARSVRTLTLLGGLIAFTVSGGFAAQGRTDAPPATSADRLFSLVGNYPLGEATKPGRLSEFRCHLSSASVRYGSRLCKNP
jgi:hypothetical protein